MKKILLTLTLVSTLSLSAQIKKMEGSWVSETSSYVTTIITNDSTAIKVYNTSFTENRVIDEKIINQNGTYFTTNLRNEYNEYEVYITYTLKDSNTIICQYHGDLNKKIIIKKLSYFWVH